MIEVTRTPGPGQKYLEVLIKGMDGMQGKVGWFESARYENGTPIAGIAMVQEFGSAAKGIPPRSFMRSTIMQRKEEWAALMMRGSKAILSGTETPMSVMGKLALQAQGDVAKKIASIWTPPLAESTIKGRIRRRAGYQNLKTKEGKAAHVRKKFETAPKSLTKPLVDTGIMLQTLSSQVEKS